jgi:hypothetical protein
MYSDELANVGFGEGLDYFLFSGVGFAHHHILQNGPSVKHWLLSDDADAIESVGGVYLVQIDQSHDP